MNNNGQETPYQIALRDHPPRANGTVIRYHCPIIDKEGNRSDVFHQDDGGEIISHRAIWENNAFKNWVYFVVPTWARMNGHILHTTEVNEIDVIV